MNENCGKITITNTIKALGDFFYRNCQCIIFGIFMVCLCIIVQIKFKIVPFFAYSVYADAINEILVNLSFSYIAAYIFYQLTSKFLLTIRNRKIRPVIQKRVEEIGRRSIYYVLLEFSRESPYSADYKHIDNTAKILESKLWTDEMPAMLRQFGVRISYLNYVRHQCDDLKERVSEVIKRYRDEMTVEQITALEEMTDLYIFRLVDLFCSLPNIKVDPGNNPFVEEYLKLHRKYLEVERLFGIDAKD